MSKAKPRVVWVVEWKDKAAILWHPRSPLYESRADAMRAVRDLRQQFSLAIRYRVAKYVRSER